MTAFYWFLVSVLSFIAVVILAIVGDVPQWSYFITGGIGIMSLFAVLRGVILPSRTVTRGLEMISSQDYNNRLVKVGEINSDKIVRLFNTLIDRLREERLYNREQESLLRLLIDASPMGVLMLDFDGKVTLYNSSFIKLGKVSKSEILVGKRIGDLNSDIIPEMLNVPLGENRVFRIGFNRIYRCYHLNFIQEGFKRDFYLIESLIEEIRKAEREGYEKVIRTISHEVNNSIGGVRSVLEMVKETSGDPELALVAESCDNRCENLVSFIHAYADVVKMPDAELKKIDLAKEIKSMLPFIEQIIPENIKFRCELPDSSYINGDVPLLQQVIVNIVKNAVESIEGKGEIVLKLSCKDGNAVMEISDDGKPISEKNKEELFRPFFTTKKNGKGIGLTVVKEVLGRHGADYSLTSDADGITRFIIIFNKI